MMRNTLFVITIVLLIAVETSVVPVLQGGRSFIVPSVIASYVIATVITQGFLRTWKKIVVIGVIADITLFMSVGSYVIFLTLCAYGANVLTHGFSTKHRVWTTVLLAGLTMLQIILGTIIFQLNTAINTQERIADTFAQALIQTNIIELLWTVLSMLCVTIVFIAMKKRIDTFLSYYEQTVDVKRHS